MSIKLVFRFSLIMFYVHFVSLYWMFEFACQSMISDGLGLGVDGVGVPREKGYRMSESESKFSSEFFFSFVR